MIFMKKALLWTVIASLALALISCTALDCELPTTETTTPETTGYCNGDCTTTVQTTEFDVFPPAPSETEEPQPTCNTGNVITPSNTWISPEDEKKVSVVHYVSTAGGPTMKVILYGYKSNMLGESFYFKNNEPIEMKVVVKNETDAPIYQWQPTMCHGMKPPHNHEISVSFKDKNGHALFNANENVFMMACPQAIDVWSLAPGERYEWNLSYFAGTAKENVIWKDPICDTEFSVTFEYYGNDIYTNGVCHFEGSVEFVFGYEKNGFENCNTETLSIPLSLKVFYVGE